MPSTYTTSLGLTLPATGELAGQWGQVTNDGITKLVDDSLAGTASITVGGSDYTLTATQGAANEARKMFITATGSPGAARNVIVPAVSKLYFVYNNTTGGYALTFKTPSGTGISVANGARMVLYCDGTNVVNAINAITLASPLPTASGGTGLNSFAANRVFYASSTSAIAQSANLTFDGTTLTAAALSGPLNGTVGATTPAAGAFTTLSASSTVTLSGGTANGVLYLNGSKVATTGSALTFDGTEVFKNSGGTIQYNDVKGSAAAGTRLSAGGTLGSDSFDVFQNASGAWVYNRANTFLAFGTNNAERMRLDASGNLGVGTATVTTGEKMEVAGGVKAQSFNAYSTPAAFSSSGGASLSYSGAGVAVLRAYSNGSGAAGALTFNASGSENMRLDASGNLGVGTASPAYKLDVLGSAIRFGDSASYLGRVGAFSGEAYLASDTAGSALTFYNKPIGGSLTERVRIDSSGNLGVGTASPSAKLTVNGDVTVLNQGTVKLSNSDATNSYSLQNGGATGSGNAYLAFTQVGVAERMRLDSSGKLSLGYPTARGNFDVGTDVSSQTTQSIHIGYSAADYYGWRLTSVNTPSNTSAGNFKIQRGTVSAWTDAVTLDNDGNVGIGTAPSTRLDVRGYDAYNFNTATFGNGTDVQSLDILTGRQLTNNTVGGVTSSTVMTLRSSGTNPGEIAFASGNQERIRFDVNGNIRFRNDTAGTKVISGNANGGAIGIKTNSGSTDRGLLFGDVDNSLNFTEYARVSTTGNFLVGATSGTYKSLVNIAGGADGDIFLAGVSGVSNGLTVQWNNSTSTIRVRIANIPTSSAGLPSGTLWNDGGTLKIA